jgi:flap endonuclease-1
LGCNLRPIIVRKEIRLEDLHGRTLAVDANNMLYQFLSLIRAPDGISLKDPQGRTTSHLAGLLFRSTRLMLDYSLRFVFVFDGQPHPLKARVLAERRAAREKARVEWYEALRKHDLRTAWSKAVMMSKLDQPMIDDAKRLLSLMGVPYVQAPGEGEAQAAFIALRGDVWAASSRDYDSLLFGSPRLVRYLTISGREFLPSKGISRPLKPELIELASFLGHHTITREQLVDLAIMIGTDLNEGIRGIGPKTALKLVKQHGSLENLPENLRQKLPTDLESLRNIFLHPNVKLDYSTSQQSMDEERLFNFLCDERGFSRERVKIAVERMKSLSKRRPETGLGRWVNK